MKVRICIAAAASVLVLAGCATQPEQVPGAGNVMIDTRGVNMASYQRDLADCRMYAYNARRSQGGRAAGGAIGGALAGGALGAIVGNSGTAKRAAGAGALIGGISGAGSAVRDENVIVRRCLAGRGYRVLN